MLASLTACGGDTTSSTDTTTVAPSASDSTTVDPNALELSATDWGGREFRVLGREDTAHTQFTNFEIYAEGQNGEIVNDEIYNRNSAIEDKYNVKITQTLVSAPHEELQKTIVAGEDNYDLVFADLDRVGNLALEGYFYNLYNVENINFDKPWWNAQGQ